MFQMGSVSLIILSLSVSTYLPSFHSCSLPKAMGTGMKRQYFFSSSSTLEVLANSLESSSRYRVISVPLSVRLPSVMANSGLPSHSHLTGFAPSFHDRDSITTFLETIKAE